MSHPDPDTLALVALSESAPSAAEETHLASCVRCQAELDQLRAVIAASRAVTPADVPAAPPEAVWDRIAAELSLSPAADAPAALPAVIPAQPHGVDAGRTADVVPLHRRRSTWVAAVAAGLVGLLVGLGAGHLATTRTPAPPAAVGPPPAAGARLVASAPLRPVTGGVQGTAGLWAKGAAHMLTVAVSGLPARAGVTYRVSLGAGGGAGVALGTLPAGSEGQFLLPAGVDVATHRTVVITAVAPGGPAVAVAGALLPA